MIYRLAMLTLLPFGLSSLTAQSPSLVDFRDTTVLSPAQNALVYALMQGLPDGGEAGLALINGDQTTFHGVRRDSGQLTTVDNADRHFGIGSVTKVFTATLLASLVEDGAVDLDDPVPAAYDFLFADSITFTYRQLATHTSGLPRLPNNMPGAILHPQNPYAEYDAARLETYLQERLTVAPDGNGGYSNLGFGLLGYTLGNRIDTVGYAASLRARVLDPLGMSATIFGKDSLPETLVEGREADGRPASFWDFTEAMGPAGALVSTPRDLAAFLRAQCDPTRSVLTATREQQVGSGAEYGMGLGWQIYQPAPEETIHWHSGAVGGYRSFVAVETGKCRGVVLLTNVFLLDNSVDSTGMKLLRQ